MEQGRAIFYPANSVLSLLPSLFKMGGSEGICRSKKVSLLYFSIFMQNFSPFSCHLSRFSCKHTTINFDRNSNQRKRAESDRHITYTYNNQQSDKAEKSGEMTQQLSLILAIINNVMDNKTQQSTNINGSKEVGDSSGN